MRSLLRPKGPPVADLGREADLLALFPKPAPRGVREAEPPRVGRDLPPEWLSAQAVARARQMEASVADTIRSPNRFSKPGPMATRAEHLENLKHSEDGVERMATLIVHLAFGQEPEAVIRVHVTGEVFATAKPDGGMRPLIMHSIHNRLGLGAVARAIQAEAMAASGVHQYGVGAKDGCVKAYHATAALVEPNLEKPIMSLDVSAAHQSLDRTWMMQEVHDLCPVLERPLAVWYPRDEPTTHWWRTSDGKVVDVPAGNGLDQGCPLACPSYGVSTARPAGRALEVMRTKYSKAQLLPFADDTQLQTDVDNLTHAHNAVSAEWAKACLRLNVGKTKVFAPDPDFSLGDWGPFRVYVLKCFGADLTDDGVAWEHPTQGGTPIDKLARSAIKLTAYASRLRESEDSGLSIQLAQSLLRYALVGGPQHILMCKLAEQAAVHNAAVRRAWQLVLGVEMIDDKWERATYVPAEAGWSCAGHCWD